MICKLYLNKVLKIVHLAEASLWWFRFPTPFDLRQGQSMRTPTQADVGHSEESVTVEPCQRHWCFVSLCKSQPCQVSGFLFLQNSHTICTISLNDELLDGACEMWSYS